MSEERIKELKEVGIKEPELRKLTPRQAAQLLVEKKVITEVQEKELEVRGGEKRFGEVIILEDIVRKIKTKRIVRKIPKKIFIEIESREERRERDVTLAHELIHRLHPNWNERRVENEEETFFRRDPFDDIVGFVPPIRTQPKLQLAKRPFFSRQLKKGGVVSRFLIQKPKQNSFKMFQRKKFRPGKIRMRFL